MKKLTILALGAVALAAFAATPAHAYLDASTANIILQAVFGVVAGALVVARLYWEKIKTYISRFSRNSASSLQRRDPKKNT